MPSINRTKDKFIDLLEDNAPIERLSKDVDSLTDVCSDIKMNPRKAKELENLFANYKAALIENIDRRFCESSFQHLRSDDGARSERGDPLWSNSDAGVG